MSTKTMIFHLESVKTVRNFISGPTSVKKSEFFGEKMKNENLGCIEKNVQMREFWAQTNPQGQGYPEI